jgi:phosphatidylglycerophosphatase A
VSGLTTAYHLGTWFGLGRARVAPGTVGSLGAIPLHLLLSQLGPVVHASLLVLGAGAGIWAAQKIADAEGLDDPGHVVIDEVVGTCIAMGLVRHRSISVQLLAFASFRALDVVKPWLIARAEHARPAGLGIMLDDLLAGLVAGLLARRF